MIGLPRSVELLIVLVCVLAACETRRLIPSATPSVPTATRAPISEPVPTPPVPSRSREFTNASEAQPVVRFTILAPMFVPSQVRVHRVWVFDYDDGRQDLRLLYQASGKELDPARRAVDVKIKQAREPISLDAIERQFRGIALDLREVQVHRETGYTFWERSGAAGNIAHLVWRQGSLNVELSLYGDWPQPTEARPHDLDPLLIRIAESFRPVRW